jgi:hypothetical protein
LIAGADWAAECKPAALGVRTSFLMSILGELARRVSANVRATCTTASGPFALVLLLVFALTVQTVMPPRGLSRNVSGPSQRQSEEEPPQHDSVKNAKYGLAAGSPPGRPRRSEAGPKFAIQPSIFAPGASGRLFRGMRHLRTEHANRNGTGAPLRC